VKKIVLHDKFISLGQGIHTLKKLNKEKRWIYLLPTNKLINRVKESLHKKDLSTSVDVMTFDQMMRQLFDNQSQKVLTPSEQELLVKRSVQKVHNEKGLRYFYDSKDKTGWLHSVEMWIGEVKRSGATSEQLKQLWLNHSEKYQELALIYHAFQELLHSYNYIDHEEPYLNFLQSDTTSLFGDDYAGIITEQFYDFSPIQMNVINRIAEAGYDVVIHLATDDKRPELFQWTLNTKQYFNQLGFEDEISNSSNVEKENLLLRPNRVLQHLSNNIFAKFPERIDAEGKVKILSGAGKKQEIELIASEIKRLYFELKIPLHQIALIIPNINQYRDSLQQIMAKAGIPIRLTNKEPLVRNPLIQSFISLLKALHGQKDSFVSLILSPYFSWNKNIDQYRWMQILRELAFPMNRQTWEERFSKYKIRHEMKENEYRAYDDTMKQIYAWMEQIPSNATSREYIDLFQQIESKLHIEANIKKYIIHNPTDKAAFRDIKAYEKWQELKNELVEMDNFLYEDEKVSYWDWISSFILASEKSEYSFSQGKRAGIHILQPNQIRGQEFQVVFVLGLVEGEFPRGIKNDWLMPDQERYLLREQGIHLNLSREYENQQKYQFYQSIVASMEILYLVYSAKTEDGKERLRSFFVDECLDNLIVESVLVKNLDVSDLVPRTWDDCTNEDQLTNKLFLETAPNRMEAYRQLKPSKLLKIENGISSELHREELLSPFDGNLQADVNLTEIKQFIEQKVWSTTKLNNAAQCRFAYFAQELLRLTEWEELDETINPIEKGDLIHRVLQRFFERFRNKQEIMHPHLEEEYLKDVLIIAEEEWQLFNNENGRFIHPILSDLEWIRLKRDLTKIIQHEMKWRKESPTYFYPKYLEFSFGLPIDQQEIAGGLIDPESVADKANISLGSQSLLFRGKMDRVDVSDEGKMVIYDYKTGLAPEYKEIMEGIHLQLPLYLLALEELMGIKRDDLIGAAFYTKGQNSKTDQRNRGVWRTDFLEHVGIHSSVKSKLAEEEWSEWLEKMKDKTEILLQDMQNGDFSVMPTTTCPSYCQFQTICRKEDERIKRKYLIKEGQ